MKTLSQYPGLIGEILRRAKAREEKVTIGQRMLSAWRRLLGLERNPQTNVSKISPTETIYSPDR